jgi:hypothetical protein
VLDKHDKIRLVYSPPIIRLSSNKTITLPLDVDLAASSLFVSLPDLSFPLVLAFGLGVPDAKGGFNLHFSFPSFKFGSKGEVEDESSSDEEDKHKKKFDLGFGVPKFGGKADVHIDKPDKKVHLHSHFIIP